MTTQTEIQFQAPTLNNDGSPITEALSYEAYIDTVNPPVKAYAVPASAVSAAVAGLITASFAGMLFTPVNGTTYFVNVVATDQNGSSVPSGIISFGYNLPVPAAPTGLKVS